MDFLENERDLKILADKTRLNILQLIYQGEQCGCELIHNLDITQPTLSHHLKVLSDAGFIVGEKEKNKILYSIKMDRIEEVFKQLLDAITCKKDCDI
jgi:ArsR family transcriptional regulator